MAREPDPVKSRGIELEKDAWSRAEREIDKVAKSSAQLRIKARKAKQNKQEKRSEDR